MQVGAQSINMHPLDFAAVALRVHWYHRWHTVDSVVAAYCFRITNDCSG